MHTERDPIDALAIIGLSVKFPQDATTPEAFWEMLREGRSAASRVPADRFNVDAFYHPDPSRLDSFRVTDAHFMAEDPRAFDASFFNMSAAEASVLDPQQRGLLESSYHCFENAGIPLPSLVGSNTAVFVACFGKDYDAFIARDIEAMSRYHATGSGSSSACCIHSMTRKYLLGADHPAASPVNHDQWSFVMRKVAAAEVKALNPGLIERVPIFCGDGGVLNSIPIRFGEEMTVTAYSQNPTAAATTDGPTDATATRAKFDKTLDNFNTWRKDCRDLAELIRRDPSAGWPILDHDPAPFYAKRRICVMGDAAHATFPFNGQGAAQAIEDAAVLNALFKEVTRLEEVDAALRAYDEVRRPRSQKVAALARQFGRMYAFIEPGVGRDLDKTRKIMGAGAVFTNNVDLDAQNEAAVSRFMAAVEAIRD